MDEKEHTNEYQKSQQDYKELERSMIDSFFSDNFTDSLVKSIELSKSDDKDIRTNALRYYSMSLYKLFSLDNIINNLLYVINNSTPIYKDYSYLGLCYSNKRDYASAIEIFLKGLNINERDYGLNYNLALSYYYNSELDKAEEYSYKAISIDGSILNAYQLLYYMYNNNFAEPERSLKIEQLLNTIDESINRTGDKDLLFLAANYNFETGNFSKALEYLNRLIVLDNTNIDYFLLRAKTHFQLEDYVNSQQDIDWVLGKDINNLDAHCLNVRIAYLNNNITEQTLKSVDVIIENSDKISNGCNFLVFNIKANSLSDKNELQKSADYYTKAFLFIEGQSESDIIDLHLKRADVYLKINDLDSAESDLLDVLNIKEEIGQDLDENDIDLLQKLLVIYAKQNRVDDITKTAERIKTIREKNSV
jgi:tetratricopeptide (TPR) repeat protein